MTSEHLLIDGPQAPMATFIFAHGAGAPMDTPFMDHFAKGIAAAGVKVVRFEFPYMQRRRLEGKKSPPNSAKILEAAWLEKVEAFRDHTPLFLAGKSMGGRYASLIADKVEPKGLVCLGYPFHPPGKPETLRTAHLLDLKTPALILQGERDPFGKPDEVATYNLAQTIRVTWLCDGDHGFKPRKASGRTEIQNWDQAVAAIVQFIRETIA